MTAQLSDKSAIQVRPYDKDDRDQVISILISGFNPVGTRMFHHVARKSSTAFAILLKSTTIAFLFNLAWVAYSNNWSSSLSGSRTPLSDWNLAHLQLLLTHPRLLQRILVQFMQPSFLILWALTSVVVAVYTLAKLFKFAMDSNMAYIRSSLQDDLADISAYYQDSSKSQFWVACLASHPQLVLGCVALDDNAAHVEHLKKKHLAEGRSEDSFKMPDPETSELRRMSVHPDYRRLGIGKRMLQALKAHAVEKGFKRVTLGTTMFQVEAIAGYKQFGFEEKQLITLYGVIKIWLLELDLTKEAQAEK
ncbi:N-acetylaspartate synthetase [Podila verticillata]|nr:N-acetylaspartate synthetase [Podila verticillata]